MALTQQQFLAEARHLVVYGLKRSGEGYAHSVVKELKRVGRMQLSAVHPHAPELGGLMVVSSATQLRPPADGALVILKMADTRQAVDDAHAAGIGRVWLPFEAARGGNLEYARELGLEAVSGCPLVFLEGVSFPHSIHRALWRLFHLA